MIAGRRTVSLVRSGASPARLGCLIAFALFGLATTPPLCHASPPDPTWVGGLYDDADHDDVVQVIVSAVAVPAEPPGWLWQGDASSTPSPALRHVASPRSLIAQLDRGPPLT
jgi:hypothetical protein